MNISYPHHCNQSCTNLAFIRNRDHVATTVLTSAPRVVISRCKKRRNIIKIWDISQAGHLPSYSRLLEKLRTPHKHPKSHVSRQSLKGIQLDAHGHTNLLIMV